MKNFIKRDRDIISVINKMAIPMILNSVIGMLIGLIDMAMIGRISIEAFGAVGLISTTINSITGVLGAISIAFNITGAKCRGQDNGRGFRESFITGSTVSIMLGVVFWIICIGFGRGLLQWMYGLEGELLDEAVSYLNMFSLTLGLNMLLFMHSALFKILNKTSYLLIGNITATVANVILNYILIFGKLGIEPMGVMGAGLGSVLSLLLNLFIYMVIVRRRQFVQYGWLPIKSWVIVSQRLIKSAVPLMGQEVLESTVLVICINAILSRIGVLEVSIYTFLYGITSIMLMPMYAYGSTALTCVSEQDGKKNHRKLRYIPRYGLGLTLGWCILLGIAIWVFRYPLAQAITTDKDLIIHSIEYLGIAMVTYLCMIPNTIYKYSLQGVGQEKWVFLNATVINMLGIILIYGFSHIIGWGICGMYIGLGVNYVMLSIRYSIRYRLCIKLLR